jgi:hypothetical protein
MSSCAALSLLKGDEMNRKQMMERRLARKVKQGELNFDQLKELKDTLSGALDTDHDGIPFYRDNDETVIDVIDSLRGRAEEVTGKWNEVLATVAKVVSLLDELVLIVDEVRNGKRSGRATDAS